MPQRLILEVHVENGSRRWVWDSERSEIRVSGIYLVKEESYKLRHSQNNLTQALRRALRLEVAYYA